MAVLYRLNDIIKHIHTPPLTGERWGGGIKYQSQSDFLGQRFSSPPAPLALALMHQVWHGFSPARLFGHQTLLG